MKKTILLIMLMSSIVFSQKTFNYISEHIVQKDNSTNVAVAESDNPVVVTFVMYDDRTGYLNFSSGAFITLYQFNGGDGVFNWYWLYQCPVFRLYILLQIGCKLKKILLYLHIK